MENKPMIYGAMAAILAEVGPVAKEQENKAQGWKFRGIDQVYEAINRAMAKHGVFCAPTVVDQKKEERTTKSGGVSVTRIFTIKYQFFAADGSCVECTVVGEGADLSDKAGYKAMAGAHKYALTQCFVVPYKGMDDGDKDYIEHASVAQKQETIAATPDEWRNKVKELATEKNINAPELVKISKRLFPKKNIQQLTEDEFKAIAEDIEAMDSISEDKQS